MLRAWVLVLMLAGCATVPDVQRPAQPDAPFIFSGRVLVKHGAHRDKAGVRWTHYVGADEILLLAPLGQTVARILRNEQSVSLETADRRYVATDMEALMQQALGWQLPLSGLRYWVVGLPAPEEGDIHSTKNAHGQLATLYQQGWGISYTRYASSRANALPLRMHMSREGMEVWLVIDEWELLPP